MASIKVPSSQSTVTVRMIDTTGYIKAQANVLHKHLVAGHDIIAVPSYAFLITNEQTKEHVLYDLGIRKDWHTGYPPSVYDIIGGDNAIMRVLVDKSINEILDADPGNLGITSSSISSCIWSHHHFDHRGDISLFPSSTKLIFGPGLRSAYPTYPTDQASSIYQSELEGREVVELNDFPLTIGDYPAHDLFGDGSLYLLSAPGHTAGHLCALARTTSSPSSSTFIFLGGDCAHHCAQFRPSPDVPVPESITLRKETMVFSHDLVPGPPHRQTRTHTFCPGSYITSYLSPHSNSVKDSTRSANPRTTPFYDLLPEPINHSYPQAISSRDKMMGFDADPNVLVILAHDTSVMGVLPFYPESLNGWNEKEWGDKENMRWEFMGDFDLSGAVERKKRKSSI